LPRRPAEAQAADLQPGAERLREAYGWLRHHAYSASYITMPCSSISRSFS
jgi:hypothetical protein